MPLMTKPLTTNQEKYCQARARGLSQRAAYREAYPNSREWKDSAVDSEACKVEHRPKVSQRLAELMNQAASASVASRTAVIDRMADMNRRAYDIALQSAAQGLIDKDAANVMMQSGAKLLDVLPDDSPKEEERMRTYDFGMLLGRVFVDLHRGIIGRTWDEIWMKGGRGSLKTSTAAIEVVGGVTAYVGRNAICMRNRANKLRTSVYAEIKKAAKRLDVYDEFEWGKSPLQAEHKPTGNVIYFFGADNINPEDSPLKGFAPEQGYIAYLWFEEASQFPGYDYIRNIKQTVLRGNDNEPTWTFLTYNPPMSTNAWVNKEARQVQPGRIVHHSHFKDAPKQWLGDAFYAIEAALRKRNPKAAAHEYDGAETGTGANVIDPEIIQVRRITDEERATISNISHGVDAGSVHPWVHERVGYDENTGVLYIMDEDSATGSAAHDTKTTPLLFERLDEFGELGADLWCDSAAAGMIRYYRDQGLNAREAYKQGVNSPRERVRWFNRCSAIIIDPVTAPMAAEQFPAMEYVRTAAGDITETLPKVNDDAIDAVGYAASLWIRQGL